MNVQTVLLFSIKLSGFLLRELKKSNSQPPKKGKEKNTL